MEEQPTITTKIGKTEITWNVFQTRAPKAYDGFGTFTAADYGDEGRLVLVRPEHTEYQRARYGSGMFACEPPEYLDSDALEQELWLRLTTERA